MAPAHRQACRNWDVNAKCANRPTHATNACAAPAIVRTQGVSLLIDCGPDFRQQMLRASDLHLDALLITHSHYDHVGGMDDLRPYSPRNPIPVYAQPNS